MFLSTILNGSINALLFFFAPAFCVLAMLWFWKWKIDRRAERNPLAEKLLRPAGEHLRKQIERIDEDLDVWMSFLMAGPAVLGVILFSTIPNQPHAIWTAGATSVSRHGTRCRFECETTG
jgi:hypothetical protein